MVRIECIRFIASAPFATHLLAFEFSTTSSSIGVNLVHNFLRNILIHISRGESLQHVECMCGDVSRSHVAGIPQGQVPQVLDCLHVADDILVDQKRLEHEIMKNQ